MAEKRGMEYLDAVAIKGGTSEALERLLKRSYKRVFSKTVVARNIAPHMDPNRNRSKSFQVFVEGLRACVEENS